MGYQLRPCEVREMTEPERAYIGAMIEGEGNVRLYNAHKSCAACRTGGGHWRITVVNTDVEIISALLRATGVGRITRRTPEKLENKPCYSWFVGRYNDILSLVRQSARYSTKLQQVTESGWL